MEKKIVELSSLEEHEQTSKCLVCGYVADHKLKINRINLGYDDSIISFNVCNSCLAKMQKDIEICE
jgi:hypothetical protein